MKIRTKKLITALLSFCAAFCCALGFSACGGKVDGVYYFLRLGKTDRETFYSIDGDSWSDEDGNSGKCKTDGNNIVFYIEIFGETEEVAKGTVIDGVLKISDGYDEDVYVSDKHSHAYGDWEVLVEASCTVDGTEARTCTCGAQEKRTIKCVGQHTGNWETEKEATCTEKGLQYLYCSTCNQRITQETDKLPHNLKDWECDNDKHYKVCSDCKQKFEAEKHDDANCCTVCGYPFAFTRALDNEGNHVGYEVFKAQKNITVANIPTEFNGKPVISIRYNAFENCTQLKSITLPNVKFIGKETFKGCSSLTSITIPDSVTSIGSGAFRGCSALKSITIPDSVTSIGSGAFYDCSALTSVTIPDGVTSIGINAFCGCSALTSVTIPDSVTSIGEYAFSGCSAIAEIKYTGDIQSWCSVGSYGITGFGISDRKLFINDVEIKDNLVIPDGVTKINGYAFYKCNAIVSVTVPDSVTDIGESAFGGCRALASISVGENNANYASQDGILYNKTMTKSIHIPKAITGAVTIPDGVTSIGSSAFEECTSLESITIPDGVTAIGESAFLGCSALTSVTIPDSVTRIGNNAFYGCDKIEAVSLPASAIEHIPKPNLKTAVITSGESIGYEKNTFYGSNSLTSVTVPDSVTRIDSYTFRGCSALEKIKYTGDIASWCAIKVNYIPKDKAYIGAQKLHGITKLVIPDGVTAIGDFAFEGCSQLTDLTVPDSVTSIGKYSFAGCPVENAKINALACSYIDKANLKTLAVTGKDKVVDSAFANCNELISVTLSDNIAEIGGGVFYNCPNLESVKLGNKITELSAYYHNSDKKNWGFFQGCAKLSSVTLPNDLKIIGINAFQGCTALGEISIPDGVTTIESSAFSGCTGLTEITIPESVTSIKQAFWGCNLTVYAEANEKPQGWTDNLNGFHVGSTYQSCPVIWNCKSNDKDKNGYTYAVIDGIRYSLKEGKAIVIEQKRSITSAVIPEKVTYGGNEYAVTEIGKLAFYRSNTESITLPDGLQKIDTYAFYESALKSVNIPGSVTTIGTYSFERCFKLENVVFNHGLTYIYDSAFYSCSSLTFISIPSSVRAIYSYAFCECRSVKYVYYGGTTAQWKLIEKGKNWDEHLGSADSSYYSDYTLHTSDS